MKTLYQPALGTFNFICIILAGYMTFKQIQIYFDNSDTSAISFQRFTEGPIDIYPTYTFCIEDGGRGNMYLSREEEMKRVFEKYSKKEWLGGQDSYHFNVIDDKLVILPGERPYNCSLHNGEDCPEDDNFNMADGLVGILPPGLVDWTPDNHDGSITTEGSDGNVMMPGSHGGLIFPGSHGGDMIPGSHVEGIIPGSHDEDMVPHSDGGDILPGSHGGGIQGSHGEDIMPGNYGEDIMPGSHGEGIMPGSHGGGIMPGSHGGDSMPGSHGEGIMPGSHGGGIMPGSHGGSLMPGGNNEDKWEPWLFDPYPAPLNSLLGAQPPMYNPNGLGHTEAAHNEEISNTDHEHNNAIHGAPALVGVSNFSLIAITNPPDPGFGIHLNSSGIDRFKRNSNEIIHLTKCEKEQKKGVYLYPEEQSLERKHLITWSSNGQWYGIMPRHFSDLIMGYPGRFMWQPSSGQSDPVCRDVKYTLDDLSEFVFDDNVLDLKKFVLDYFTKSTTGSFAGWINKTYELVETECGMRSILGDTVCGTQDSFKTHLLHRTVMGFPLRKIFQDPTKMCYTPDLLPGVHKKSDQITIDLTNFLAAFSGGDLFADATVPMMTLHIHMQNQLMRSIGKELSSMSHRDLIRHCPEMNGFWEGQCFGTRLTYDISQVTLLKSRHDAENKCDKGLKDEDSKMMESILNDTAVRCVPMFWMGLKNYSSTYPKCTTDSQYKRIGDLTRNFTNLEKVRKMFTPPCEEMIIVTNVQRVKGRLRKEYYDDDLQTTVARSLYLDIQFRHVNDRYQVITNTRGFSVESCWSGIGGFIGIFVGVSMMQLPEIFMAFFTFSCKGGNKKDEDEKMASKFKS